jgi:universal stress protein A
MSDYSTFLVPYDFSEHARAALDVASDLARRLNADLHLVHVLQVVGSAYDFGPYGGVTVPPMIDMTKLRQSAMKSLRDVVDGVEIPGEVEPHVVEGASVAEMIRKSATNLAADLIVMGTHGRTGLAHAFLGSVAERTQRTAPCPVVAVRGHEDRPPE